MIRRATLDDLYAIEEVERTSFRPEVADDRMEIEYWIKRGWAWVYEGGRDRAIVGYVCVKLRPGRIESLAVSPDAQGSKIGTALVNHALNFLQEVGSKSVALECGLELVSFYARFGFLPAGYMADYYGPPVPAIYMRRAL